MKRSKKSTQKGGKNDCNQKLKQCEKKNTELKNLSNKFTKDYLSKQLDLIESVSDIRTAITNLPRERRESFNEIWNDWRSRLKKN